MKTVNLDYSAAVPLDDLVVEAMMPFITEEYGNPSSGHSLGKKPRQALEAAREHVGRLINAAPKEIIFTASASEANNMAVKGMAAAGRKKGRKILASAIEHFSVLNPLRSLQKEGFEIELLPVDRYGLVDPQTLAEAITADTILVSIQAANPEIGTVQSLRELVAVARDRGVPFHTDAAAAAGWLPLDVEEMGIDLLSLAGDQFYGPKGSGALYLRKGLRLLPLIEGGTQERGLRAGTENLAAIAGLGEAARLAADTFALRTEQTAALRNRLQESLFETIPNLHLNGHPRLRLPRNLNISVEFVEGEALLMRLDMAGIYVSSGSSCSSQALKSSHVLAALGVTPELAQGSLSLSLGPGNSEADIAYVTGELARVTGQLRNMSPLYHQHLKGSENNA